MLLRKELPEKLPSTNSAHRIFSARSLTKLAALLVILAGVIFGVIYVVTMHRSSFAQNVTSSVTYRPFYPHNLPRGYTIQTSSIQVTNGVAMFPINGTFFVSQQAIPPNFDFDTFYTQQMAQTNKYVTPDGTVTTGLRKSSE